MIGAPNASAVPGAVRAISYALTSALGANVAVIVGPGNTDDPDLNGLVMVGVDDADEASYAHAVTGSQSWAQLGGMYRDETFAVHCVAVAWNGDTDTLAAMDSVYSLLGAITQALVNDATLQGALLYAPGITAQSLKFASDDSGVAAHLTFDVECRARI
jgi:hypothetical protein